MKKPKTYWNYRLIRKAQDDDEAPFFFEVHEVHYEDGKPVRCSDEPCVFGGDTPVEVAAALSRALQAALCEAPIDISVFPS